MGEEESPINPSGLLWDFLNPKDVLYITFRTCLFSYSRF